MNKPEPWGAYIGPLVFALIVAAVLVALGKGAADCEDRGGVYVRSLTTGFTCAAPQPPTP